MDVVAGEELNFRKDSGNMNLPVQRIERDALITSTMVALAKTGDFLHTVEWSLENIKRSGAEDFVRTFGQDGRLKSKVARSVLKSHLKRFETDMARMLRYSVVVSLYTLFESRARHVADDFGNLYPEKPCFKQFKRNLKRGFVRNLQCWLESKPRLINLKHPRIWDRLDDFRIIRNCIAHANGELSLTSDQETLKNAVRRTRNVQLDNSNALVLEIAFAFEMLERLTTFFRLLFREAGYGMECPPGYHEAMAKRFTGFENEIVEAVKAYDRTKTF